MRWEGHHGWEVRGGLANKALTPGRLCMYVQMVYIQPIKEVCGL